MAQMLKQSPFCSSIGTNTHSLTYSAGFLLKVTFVRGLVIRQKRTAPIKTASKIARITKIATLFADKVTNSPSTEGSARRAREAFLQLSLFPLKYTAVAMSKVSTPPKRYANMRFSIPNIIGDINIYDEQTYVIINAGNAPIAIGLLFLYK